SETDAWALGSKAMLHYDGTAWRDAGAIDAQQATYRRISGSGPTDLWVTGTRGAKHYDGQAWTDRSLPDGGWLDKVWPSPDGTAFGTSFGTSSGTLPHLVQHWTPASGWTPSLVLPNSPLFVSGL